MTWLWGLLAALALLWPDRLSGPFDGVPLDRAVEAILVGVVFPSLWWFHARFLNTRTARVAILLLIAWKICGAAFLVQDGWCVRFTPARSYVRDGTGAPHAWDLRADWRPADPACSAIMRRPYARLADFPAWFFNLPPTDNNALNPQDRPPLATTTMTVQGFLSVPDEGLLHVETGPDVAATLRVDGGIETGEARLSRGVHTVNIAATLTGDRWQFSPVFNGRSVFDAATPTVRRPSRIQLAARPWLAWIPSALVVALLGAWLVSAGVRAGDPLLLLWSAASSTGIGLLVAANGLEAERWTIALLAVAAFLPWRPRVRNVFGAFVAIGVPWLTFVVVSSLPAIGHFTLYEWGDDWTTFQRFAYRIVLQGYWLEGGSATFWFQPLYRWIAGLLHVVFGDSSVGEWYWDGACLLAGSLFSFRVVRRYAGFRWGLVAAVAPLGLFIAGNERVFIGRGLGEISSAGLLYLAASFVMRSRHGRVPSAIAAGVFATLGFYTRLNNLPIALCAAAFALPLAVPARLAFMPWTWWRRVAWRPACVVVVTIAAGVLFFAWRTWHYTGVFSVVYGTSRDHLSLWTPGLPLATWLERVTGSVMMVLTLNDPARYDPYALPVLGGAAVAVLSLIGVPKLNRLPLALVLFFFSTIVGAFVARGSAYSGRFSLHVIPVTCALFVAAMATLAPRAGRRPRDGQLAAARELDQAGAPPFTSSHSSASATVLKTRMLDTPTSSASV